MRFLLADMIEHREDIVRGARLRIRGDVLRYVGRRKATRVEGNGVIMLSEMPYLPLEAAEITGEFVSLNQRMARSGFLEIEAHPVACRRVRHIALLGSYCEDRGNILWIYSITLSALPTRVGGITKPNAFAVLRLIAISPCSPTSSMA